ncbi:MAG: right-handed parallel beta-helix repeat-containing protein [Spirochaetes bacterium]|nr:right-handed parallel beta-helix repeat-containing protein [Spirochaetota bacterium]
MKYLFILLIALPLSAMVELFVSPAGNDAWSGKTADVNAAKTDGPFASVERARDEIRSLKSKRTFTGATVYLRGGRYELARTVTFTPSDSGTKDTPVVYAAYKNEKPVLSAGKRLAPVVKNGRWEVPVPESYTGNWDFSQLFVNGERRNRVRIPETGYFYIGGAAPASTHLKAKQYDAFRYSGDEFSSSWEGLIDVEVQVFHVWSTSRLRVAAIDGKSKSVAFTGPTFRNLSFGSRYQIENVKSELKKPGAWCLDASSGTFLYLPKPGETPANTEIIAPRLERVIEMKGDLSNKSYVEFVSFKGIVFTHANFQTPLQGWAVSQAEFSLPSGVVLEGTRDISFDGCRFTQMSANGLDLAAGTKRCRVERCEFVDLGGGGVKLGPVFDKTNDENITSHNIIRDCLIAHNGRHFPAACGIFLRYAHDNVIEHNDIYDSYYSGISAGWTWGSGPSPSSNNIIAYNHIFDVMQNVLTDGAGIYTLGSSPGTVIRGNHIHDVEGVPWAVGIYLDQGTSHTLAEDNLVYRITTHAYNLNADGGRSNIARNNIFGPILDEKAPMFRRGKNDPYWGFLITTNIIYWDKGVLATEAWTTDSVYFNANVYWNSAGNPFMMKDKTFAEWQGAGFDAHSVVADPKFMDPAKDDWRLQPSSPALALGFKPFDYTKAGRITKTADVKYPRQYDELPQNPPLPKMTYDFDFENMTPGQMPVGDAREEGNGVIRVNDRCGAGGSSRSLAFVDAAGIKSYNPHLILLQSMKYTNGNFRMAFDIMNDREKPGDMLVECRDWQGGPINTGWNISLKPDGRIIINDAGGKNIDAGLLPNGTWAHVDIRFSLGASANGLSVEISSAGKPLMPRKAIPYASADFKTMTWLGIIAMGTNEAYSYIDNLYFGDSK